MKKHTISLFAVAALGMAPLAVGQTIWEDTFNRADTTPDDLGSADVGGSYTIGFSTPTDREVSISSNEAYFDWQATGAGDVGDAIAYASVTYTGFSLDGATGNATWQIDMRNTGRNGPWPTLGNGSSMGMILGSNESNPLSSTADGYALIYYADSDGGSSEVRLGSFTDGVDNFTELAATGSYGSGTQTFNQVTYEQGTNIWSLWSNTSGTFGATADATVVNTTYTGTTLVSSGMVQVANAGNGTQADRDAYFDNASFTVVPEPSTAALLGLGASALLLLNRRRRSRI